MVKTLILSIVALITLSAQELDIISALRLIESGRADSVRSMLSRAKDTETAGYIFVDALTTEQGQASVIKFEKLLKNYPNFKYNDAAIFRLHSYYYALGSYNRAKELSDKLEKEYPDSPYRKQLDKMLYSEENSNEPVQEENIRTPFVSNTSAGYILQVGAFLNKSNAERFLKSLSTAGYDSYLEEKEIGGSVFSVVFVGEFNSEEESQTVKQKIDREFKTNAKIISAEK